MINELPKVGLGTWQVTKQQVLTEIIGSAYKAGYRHIDTAILYMNEKQIGKAIIENKIDRKKLFITSKIWNIDFKGQRAYKAVLRSLKKLQTNYLDLMLLHIPAGKSKDRINAYKNLIQARKDKLVNKIGVSNFNIEQLKEIKKETGEYPYCNQIILTPTTRRIELEKFCKKNKIILTGYSTLRSYFDKNAYYPDSGMNDEQKKYVDNIADKYKKNVGQVLSKWALQNGYHIIPKSTKSKRVISNFDLNDFELNKAELDKLNSFNNLISDEQIMKKIIKTANNPILKSTLKMFRLFGKI